MAGQGQEGALLVSASRFRTAEARVEYVAGHRAGRRGDPYRTGSRYAVPGIAYREGYREGRQALSKEPR